MKEIDVIILDDEPSILELCVRLFAEQSFGVFATADHLEAMRLIESQDVKVVLSDNRMPGITGVEFLRQVKEKKSDAIRILFTGHADIQVAEEAINKGEVYRLLNKPLDLKVLLMQVKEAIEKFDLIRNNQDLTRNIKARNEELEVLSAQLKDMYEVQKQFTYTLSHELRTPLMAIKSSVDILNSETPGKLTGDQKMFIQRVKISIDRLSRLINEVLDLSKFESGKMVMHYVTVCPKQQVLEIVDMFKSVIQNMGLNLELVFGADLPEVMVDRDRFAQVFSNLVNNALKFIKTGKITIAAYCEDKKNVTFCVRDTGVGIKEEDIPKLFEKFQQIGSASQQVGGTGLGLVICKEIIEKHGGHIWVESTFGKGSSFYFTIPAIEEN